MAKAVPIHKLTQPNAPLRASAPVILVRLDEMMQFMPAVQDPQNVTELHDMRIAAKRLRYTVEVFVPTLPSPDAKKVLKKVEAVQERLGAIHDCDMLIPLLEETLDKEQDREKRQALKKHSGPPPYFAAEGLAPLIARKRSERDQLYKDFIDYWNALPPEEFVRSITKLIAAPAPDTDHADPS